MDSLLHFAPQYNMSDLALAGGLLVSAALGALLGLERSLAGKHAGMRTYALVSLGSCLFTAIGVLASLQLSFMPGTNPLGVAASVVIGIGFIGSGLAAFRGGHPVELTTATGIWVAAGVGMACGFGYYLLALSATFLGLIIFSFFYKVEKSLSARFGYDKEKE
jgi:putative Mg2+ transporter-C (MgtC) family protein